MPYHSKQPNSRMCFACGLENPFGLHLHFYDNSVDEVVTRFTITSPHQGYPGIAHGGIVAAILDEVGGRAIMIGDPMRFFSTVKMEARYRQPVRVEVPLEAVGRLVKLRGRFATTHAEIRSAESAVLTEADCLYALISSDQLNLSEADRLAWKVYPEGG